MFEPTIEIAVGGGTPGADSNDYILFESPGALFGKRMLPMTGIKRVTFEVFHNQAGTLKAYKSIDGGVTYDLYDTQGVAIPGAGTISGPFDYDIAPFSDWKLVWTNGGSAQTTWRPSLKGHTDRVPAI
jgi:hypothetical protein